MQRISTILLICTFITLALSASPPSFCKCTCFNNSTIIQLGPSNKPVSPDSSSSGLSTRLSSFLDARAASHSGSSCNKCNRRFCHDQNIPFCKNIEESDILTTCFQRDSRKDQIIVLLFIAATVGLLVWSGVRRLLYRGQERENNVEVLGEYVPVGRR